MTVQGTLKFVEQRYLMKPIYCYLSDREKPSEYNNNCQTVLHVWISHSLQTIWPNPVADASLCSECDCAK